MPNWKTPDLDFVQGFWLKNFKSIQESLRRTLKKMLRKQKRTNAGRQRKGQDSNQ